MTLNDISIQFNNFLTRFGLQINSRSIMDMFLLFTFVIPASILFYLIFDKFRHKILVDLGQHKWLVRWK
jgi:hypothetical protein